MSNRTVYRKNYISYQEYVEGNVVRKQAVPEIPQRTERTYIDNKRVNTSKSAYRNREKALHMSAPYVFILAVCTVMMFAICSKYLSLRDEISTKSTMIAEIEMQTANLKSRNDNLDYTINSYMDIDYITKVATEELGMIKAGKEQISFYESSESEYMKQYKEFSN